MEKGILILGALGIVGDVLSCAEIFLFTNKILMLDYEKKIYKWILMILYIVGVNIYLLMNTQINAWIVMARAFEFFLVGILCIKGNLFEKLLKAMFSCFALGTVYDLLELIISIIHSIYITEVDRLLGGIARSLFIILFILLVHLFLRTRIGYKKWVKAIQKRFFAVWICCFGINSVISSILEAKSEIWTPEKIVLVNILKLFLTISFICLCIILIYVDMNRKKYKEDSETKDRFLELSKMHYKNLEHQVKEIKRIRHDMRAQYAALSSLIQKEDCEGANHYLEEILGKKLRAVTNPIVTGNDLLDAVICGIIRDNGDVRITFIGSLNETKLKDYDLCIILSNLINNAVEAVKDIGVVCKEIRVEVRHFENYEFIEVRNHTSGLVDIENLGIYTTKNDKDNHGIGIYNVKKTLEKYKGSISFYQNGDEFIAKVLI